MKELEGTFPAYTVIAEMMKRAGLSGIQQSKISEMNEVTAEMDALVRAFRPTMARFDAELDALRRQQATREEYAIHGTPMHNEFQRGRH